MSSDALCRPGFTLAELADALKADPAALDGFCAVAPEQMRAIACAVWRRAAQQGLNDPVPGAPHVTLYALAQAVHAACNVIVDGAPHCGGPAGPHVLFGAGAPQLAWIVEAVRRDGLRERDERARLDGVPDAVGAFVAGSHRGALA